jgi:Putative Actinobacterial Holin-X, holin superfamily III
MLEGLTREAQSMVELGREVVDGVRELVRKEIELAKLETRELLVKNAKAGALLGGGAFFALLAVVMIQVAAVATAAFAGGFAAGMYLAWGLFGLWVVLAAIALIAGWSRLELKPPARTLATLKGDLEWAKRQMPPHVSSNGKSSPTANTSAVR